MSGRHLAVIAFILGAGSFVACGSSSSGNGGGTGDGGTTPAGSCSATSSGMPSCANVLTCLQTNCSTEMTTCFGTSWASGVMNGGACATQFSCQDACGCTTSCNNGCKDTACTNCTNNTLATCALSKCQSQIAACSSSGTGGSTGAGGSPGAGGTTGIGIGGTTSIGVGGTTGLGGMTSIGTYTCTDLQTCCAKATGTNQTTCNAVYGQLSGLGNAGCSATLTLYKATWCP